MKKMIVYSAAAFVLFAIGCSKPTNKDLEKLRGQQAVSPTFDSLYNAMKSTCADCHNPSGSAGHLTLNLKGSADAAYHDLVNRKAQNPSSASTCQTVGRVHAGDPAKSFLMGTLYSNYSKNNFAGVTNCHPIVIPQHQNIFEDEKSALETWIRNGAKR